MDDTLKLYTLGGLRILRPNDEVVSLGSRKAEAILVYLACTRRPHSRETLADLFWDERSQSQTMGNLRRELSTLHQHLGELVEISRQVAAIPPGVPLWVDALEFEQTLGSYLHEAGFSDPGAASRVDDAVTRLYQGAFLEGFTVYDCQGFEEWRLTTREHYQRLGVEGLRVLAAYELEGQETQKGLAHAERLLQLEPLFEDGHRLKMCLLALSGQRSTALKQYETCQQVLKAELGVQPSEETRQLYQLILDEQLDQLPRTQARLRGRQPPFADLPEGTVTFLYSDIADATELLHRLREGYAGLLAEQRSLLRQVFSRWKGHEVDNQGDAFFVAFPRATQAVGAAVEAQRRLAEHNWPEEVTVQVRMGLHTGEPWSGEEGYVGMDVHWAGRIAHVGHGGQVLLSETTAALALDELPEGVNLVDLGRHLLKDIHRPERIRQLVIEGLPAEFPPLTSLETLPSEGARLPRQVGDCPYRGLSAFQEVDAPFYFGREGFIESLEGAVRTKQLVAVIVGSSGSGKSSALFAGLLPRLRKTGGYEFAIFRPGGEPFYALAESLLLQLEPELSETDCLIEIQKMARGLLKGDVSLLQVVERLVKKDPNTRQLLLVVDQFEELYTLCPDERLRKGFVDELLAALETARGSKETALVILLTMRADFMGQALAYRPFADALQEASLLMGPMTRQELHLAIEKPAEMQGAAFEAGLVERILDDVGEKPGNLPLLEFTLTQLWEQQSDGWLTHADYEAMGSVDGALAAYADQVYNDLEEIERAGARRALIQLVQPGEGTEDTRRLASRSELGETGWSLIQRLADRRLVVTGRDASGRETAEVVHEALIQKWGLFQEWMEADRAFRAWQERLRSSLRQWQGSQRDEGALLRGAPLAEAESWLEERGEELSAAEVEYIQASVVLRQRDAEEREARRQRELQAAQELAETQSRAASRLRRRAVYLLAALLVAALLALAAAFFGRQSNRNAQVAEQNAATAQSESQRAEAEALQRATQQSVAESEAYTRATAEAVAVAERQTADEQRQSAEEQRYLAQEQAAVGLSYAALSELDSGDQHVGLLLALEALEKYPYTWQTELALSQAVQKSRLRLILPHDGNVYAVAWSPTGDRLATASSDQTAKIWDASNGELLFTLDHEYEVYMPRWSPDGTLLATLSHMESDAMVMWDTQTGEKLYDFGHNKYVNDVSWSPDGKRLASASDDLTARVWDAQTGKELLILNGHEIWFSRVAWSPDGERIVTGSGWTDPEWAPTDEETKVMVWDAKTGERVFALPGHTDCVSSIDFSPSGERFATSSYDGTVRIWDLYTGEELLVIRATYEIGRVDWSPDGDYLLADGDDGVGVWEASTGEKVWGLPDAEFPIWSPDGAYILAHGDKKLEVWDFNREELVYALRGPALGLSEFSWAPSGERIATAGVGKAMVWDVRPFESLPIPRGLSYGLHWTKAGDRFMAITLGGLFRMWDMATQEVELEFTSPEGGGFYGNDISHAEDRIATGTLQGNIYVWDAATGQQLLKISAKELRDWMASTGVGQEALPKWSLDDSRLATGGADGLAKIWDAQTGALLLVYSGHKPIGTRGILDLWWLPDPSDPQKVQIVTAGADGTVQFWDPLTGETLRTLADFGGSVLRAVPSPDYQQIATYSLDQLIRIFDTQSGELLRAFPSNMGAVWGLVWNHAGTRLAIASNGGDALVFDAVKGVPIHRYFTNGGASQTLWSPDESQLAVSMRNRVGFFPSWKTPDELIAYAKDCCLIGELSPEERQRFGLPVEDVAPQPTPTSEDSTGAIWQPLALLALAAGLLRIRNSIFIKN